MQHSHYAIGLLSGTSADGIDAVLIRIGGSDRALAIRPLAFLSVPFPTGLGEHLRKNSLPGASSVDELCRLNALLAHLFADAAKRIAKKAGIPLADIDVIGSHGQTVHHLPRPEKIFGRSIRSTLQLGDPSMIAALTGVPTVGNFRAADMALEGQGAPLVPYLDFLLFRSKKKNRLLLNLGGIANFTVLPKHGGLEAVQAFDTGAANMVIDALMQELYRQPYDAGGKVAMAGMVSHDLLGWMMTHPYLECCPPKSTGREEFGKAFVRRILNRSRKLSPADVIATATEFTALSVYAQYVRFIRKKVHAEEVFVSGGGVHNRTLMESLARHFAPVRVRRFEKLGFSADAKEAVLFAVMAHQTMHGIPTNVPSVTGAVRRAVLGSINL